MAAPHHTKATPPSRNTVKGIHHPTRSSQTTAVLPQIKATTLPVNSHMVLHSKVMAPPNPKHHMANSLRTVASSLPTARPAVLLAVQANHRVQALSSRARRASVE